MQAPNLSLSEAAEVLGHETPLTIPRLLSGNPPGVIHAVNLHDLPWHRVMRGWGEAQRVAPQFLFTRLLDYELSMAYTRMTSYWRSTDVLALEGDRAAAVTILQNRHSEVSLPLTDRFLGFLNV